MTIADYSRTFSSNCKRNNFIFQYVLRRVQSCFNRMQVSEGAKKIATIVKLYESLAAYLEVAEDNSKLRGVRIIVREILLEFLRIENGTAGQRESQ